MNWLTDLALLKRWWQGAASTPFHASWTATLSGVAGFALLVLLLLAARLFSDTRALLRLRWYSRRTPGTIPDAALSGFLKDWCQTLRARAAKGHATGVEQMDQVLHGRYEWAMPWLAAMRTTATMIGLFFTFLGLSDSLNRLSVAMGGMEGAKPDIVGTLQKVQQSLPGLGTAFAASICGVGIAIAIGILESLMDAWRTALSARMAALSIELLEPCLVPVQGEAATRDLAAHLLQTGKATATIASTVSSMVTDLKAMAEGMSSNLKAMAEGMSSSHTQVLEELKRLADGLVNDNKQVLTELRAATSGLGQVPVTLTKVFADLLDKAGAQHATAMAEVAVVTKAHREHLNALGTANQVLAQSSAKLAQVIAGATHDLQVSEQHVRDLSTAADKFRGALETTAEIVNEATGEQARLQRKLDETFSLIPRMAEAVTQAVTNTSTTAGRLEQILGSENMTRYIQQLPELAKLAASERESREALKQAVSSFATIAETVRSLKDQIEGIGVTAEYLGRCQEDIAKAAAGLAKDHMLPVVRQLIRETAAEVLARSAQEWTERHERSAQDQVRLLSEIPGILTEVRESIDDLAKSQNALVSYYSRSLLARLLGRSSP